VQEISLKVISTVAPPHLFCFSVLQKKRAFHTLLPVLCDTLTQWHTDPGVVRFITWKGGHDVWLEGIFLEMENLWRITDVDLYRPDHGWHYATDKFNSCYY